MKLARNFWQSAACCTLLLGAGLAYPAASLAQESAAPMPAASVVKASGYVSHDPVPRGQDFQIAVVVNIIEGYHMNSHKPRESYLIPTTLTPQLPSGFTLTDTVYPNGELKKFPFSPDKALDVYTGSVTLRLKLHAGASAALGATTVPATLRYQACNNSACLPPVKVALNIPVQVAAAGTKTKALHPELFPSGSAGQK